MRGNLIQLEAAQRQNTMFEAWEVSGTGAPERRYDQVMPTKMLRQSINALSIAVLISQGHLRVFPSDGCLARHYKTDAISYGD